MQVLNNTLATRTFLVGERVTLADLSVATTLLLAYQWVLEPQFREPYTHANRWFETVVNQPNVKKALPDFQMCEKMAQFDGESLCKQTYYRVQCTEVNYRSSGQIGFSAKIAKS